MAGSLEELGFPQADLPPIATLSPESVVRFLVARLVEAGRLNQKDADQAVCAILHRESLGSTAIGGGIVLPHSKCDAVHEVVAIVGRSTAGFAWPGAIDGKPVRIVCLMLTPTSKPGESLRALEATVKTLRGLDEQNQT